MTGESIRCEACGMTFVVAPPPRGIDGSATTRCSEPGCGRRFWHAHLRRNRSNVSVGVLPDEEVTEHRDYGLDENFP